MSHVAQRRFPGSILPRLTRTFPTMGELVPALLLVGVSVVLAMRWWTEVQGSSVPLTRGLLDVGLTDFLYQLPGLAVVGVLFVRGIALAGHRTVATQHLAQMAARWAWIWVGTSLVWLALTASKLTGESLLGLGSREDLIPVLVRNGQSSAQIATVWVALVIALFVTRLTSTVETRALLVLAAAALLPVFAKLPSGGHDPGGHAGIDLHWLALVTIAVQLLAAAVWLGVLVTMMLHLRGTPPHLRRAVFQFSHTASLCALLIGSAALVQAALAVPSIEALWQTTDGQLILGKAVALVLLVSVGFRHRRRTADSVVGGRLLPLLRLAGGELVLVGAVLATTMVITPVV